MQTVQVGTLRRHVLVNIGVVAPVITGRRDWEARRQAQLTIEHIRVHVLLQVGATQASVPVVCDMATVHDLTEQVAQIFPRHFGIALQIIEQDIGAYDQISRVEGIVSVPALGAEFASLGNNGMEVAQRKQYGLELRFFGAHLQRVLVEVVQSLV